MKTRREVEEHCSLIAHEIKNNIPAGMGFVLLVSTLGAGGFSAYMSSQHRGDTIKLLREMADRLEKEGGY
jgi:hypothetical protein